MGTEKWESSSEGSTNKNLDGFKKKRILLVDDDPIYSTIIDRVAKQEGVVIDTFHSLEELGSVGAIGLYDGAIIDINLGVSHVNGYEIADYIDALNFEVPVIIVSSSENPEERELPNCVQKFMSKSTGYQNVVNEILKYSKPKKNIESRFLKRKFID